MYGWRSRIGLVVPSPNTVVEPEFRLYWNTEGIECYTARCTYPETNDELVKLSFYRSIHTIVINAAKQVASVHPNLIVWACTLGSIIPDQSGSSICQEIEEATGIPTVTAAQAVAAYMQANSINRIALFTPYTKVFTRILTDFLYNHVENLVIEREFSQGIVEGFKKGQVTDESLMDSMQELCAGLDRIDGLFMSCTNLPTLRYINTLSKKLGFHVFSSNLATGWYASQRLGL